MSRFSIEATFSAIDRITGPVNKMEKVSRQFSTGIKRDFLSAQIRMENFGNSIKSGISSGITYGVVGAGIALGYLAKRGLDLASDLQEVQNVVDTTFGNGAKTINDWANTALNKFGLSELQAKQFSSTIGAMVKPSGMASDKILQMSQDMAGLAGDFASFYNIPIEEAFNKIRSGISGETEPLKQLGKDMSVASLEAFALTQGITKQFQAMSQAEKYQLRYNYLMKSSADQIGDFNKTLKDSYANQMRLFTVQVDQLSARVMSALLPTMLEGVRSMNEFVKSIDAQKLGQSIKSIADTFISLVKTLYDMRYILGISIGLWYAYRIGMNIAAVSLWLFNGAQVAYNIAMGIATVLQNSFLIAVAKGLVVYSATTVATYAMAAATWVLNSALLANPLTWIVLAIIAAVALLGTAIYLIYNNWELVSTSFSSGINSIIKGFYEAKVAAYEFLNSIGLISDETLMGAKNQLFESISKGVDLDLKIQGIKSKSSSDAQSETGGLQNRREVMTQGQQVSQSINTNRNSNINTTNTNERLVKIKIDNFNNSALSLSDYSSYGG
jgi:hypothetical protein